MGTSIPVVLIGSCSMFYKIKVFEVGSRYRNAFSMTVRFSSFLRHRLSSLHRFAGPGGTSRTASVCTKGVASVGQTLSAEPLSSGDAEPTSCDQTSAPSQHVNASSISGKASQKRLQDGLI